MYVCMYVDSFARKLLDSENGRLLSVQVAIYIIGVMDVACSQNADNKSLV